MDFVLIEVNSIGRASTAGIGPETVPMRNHLINNIGHV